jgi:hypothetical protein
LRGRGCFEGEQPFEHIALTRRVQLGSAGGYDDLMSVDVMHPVDSANNNRWPCEHANDLVAVRCIEHGDVSTKLACGIGGFETVLGGADDNEVGVLTVNGNLSRRVRPGR